MMSLKRFKVASFPVYQPQMKSSVHETNAIPQISRVLNLPVVETFQGAGVISRD